MYINTQGQIVNERGQSLTKKQQQSLLETSKQNASASKELPQQSQTFIQVSDPTSRSFNDNAHTLEEQNQIIASSDNNEKFSPDQTRSKNQLAVFNPSINNSHQTLSWIPPTQNDNILRFGNSSELESLHQKVLANQKKSHSIPKMSHYGSQQESQQRSLDIDGSVEKTQTTVQEAANSISSTIKQKVGNEPRKTNVANPSLLIAQNEFQAPKQQVVQLPPERERNDESKATVLEKI